LHHISSGLKLQRQRYAWWEGRQRLQRPACRIHRDQHDPRGRAGGRFLQSRGSAEQQIKEGKNAVTWTRLPCTRCVANVVRLQLHALAYNLANFLRTLALPDEVNHWSLTTLRDT
jgi:hypothetical protein